MQKSKRKYQIFLSSTLEDLREERQAAIRGILFTRHMPLYLEGTPPNSESELSVISDAIADCQFCVVILGHRYGSIPAGREISYVELEFERAMAEPHCKILLFVLDERKTKALRNDLSAKSKKDRDEIANNDKFWAFRDRLTKGKDHPDYRTYSEPHEIGESLIAFFSAEHPNTPGFILEPTDDSGIAIEKGGSVVTVSSVVSEVLRKLSSYVEYEPRLRKAPEKKQALGKAFRQLFREHLTKFDQIFLESGSTITMVARELGESWPKGAWSTSSEHADNPGPRIRTNNAFAYLYLWLNGITCDPVPEGPPDARYGGMYGPLANRERAPNYSCPTLAEDDPDGEDCIQRLRANIFGSTEKPERCLVLAAASGVQLTDEFALVIPSKSVRTHVGDEELTEFAGSPIAEQIRENCRGLHVGSYNNKLFKRCLYLTGAPTIVFVHNHKIDCRVEVGKCHFVFDGKDDWKKTIRDYPLAIWVACNTDTQELSQNSRPARTVANVVDRLESSLTEGNWTFSTYDRGSNHPIVMGYNEAFNNACRALGFRHGPFR